MKCSKYTTTAIAHTLALEMRRPLERLSMRITFGCNRFWNLSVIYYRGSSYVTRNVIRPTLAVLLV